MNIGDLIPIGGGGKFTEGTFPAGVDKHIVDDGKIKTDSLVLVNPGVKLGTWKVESQVGYDHVKVTGDVSSSNIVPYKNEIEITTNDRVFANTVASGLKEVGINSIYVNTVTHDRTAPTTVINSALSTQGNGGRKLFRLENGWLVAVLTNLNIDPANQRGTRIFHSTDNGNTWINTHTRGFASTSTTYTIVLSCVVKGNTLYMLYAGNTIVYLLSYNFDTMTLTEPINIDSMQTSGSIGATSIAINPQGTELHACWSSKNSTYPNSFNIRYIKGTINADGSVKWGSVEQVTTRNTTGIDFLTPTIVTNNLNLPIIIANYENSSSRRIVNWYHNGSAWVGSASGGNVIFDGSIHAQSNPSACVDKDGVIHVAWHGGDSIDTTIPNLRYGKSIDGGVTWTTEKVSSGNTNAREFATISVNSLGHIHILCNNRVASKQVIRYTKIGSEAWSTQLLLDRGDNPSSLIDNTFNFSEPLFITGVIEGSVTFRGKWQEEIPTLSLSENVNQSKGDKLDISTKPINRFVITSDTVEPNPVPFGYALIKGVE